MKILIITDQFPPSFFGGMAMHAYNIARYLGKQHEVMVVTLRGQNNLYYADELFLVRSVLTKRFPRLDFLIIHNLARSFKPDAIHVCTAGMVNKSLSYKYPVISRVVGNDFMRPWYGYNLPLRSILYRIPIVQIKREIKNLEMFLRKQNAINNLKQSKCVIANSTWTRNRLIEEGVSKERTAIIVGGLDTDVFRPAYNKKKIRKKLGFASNLKILVTAANLVMEKNIDTVLKAVAILLPKRPNIFYLIIGDGRDKDYLKEFANRLGIGDYTLFLGRKDQKALCEYYQAADIYVQPSMETMGRTYIEAGACGIPVIAANIGGVPDVVHDGVNGLLVQDLENHIEVANKITTILKDKKLQNRLSVQGFKMANEKFSWKQVAKAFEQQIITYSAKQK